ncbi:MAG: hypothetical protein ACTTJ8_01140 [Treponema sp.]
MRTVGYIPEEESVTAASTGIEEQTKDTPQIPGSETPATPEEPKDDPGKKGKKKE